MTQLLLIIHEPPGHTQPVSPIIQAVGPYLATFGGAPSLASERSFRELRGGKESGTATVVDFQVEGTFRVDGAALCAKLERFLKVVARDTGFVASFDILLAEGAG